MFDEFVHFLFRDRREIQKFEKGYGDVNKGISDNRFFPLIIFIGETDIEVLESSLFPDGNQIKKNNPKSLPAR